MDLELYPKTNAPCIEGYGNGYINISGTRLSNTVLLLSNKYIDIGTSLENNIKNIIKKNLSTYKPDIIIYGSLKGLGYRSEMLSFIKTCNTPIEVMQIGPACRTWSVLIGDGRNICAIIESA